jgi:hypothetical protein
MHTDWRFLFVKCQYVHTPSDYGVYILVVLLAPIEGPAVRIVV